jgi:hypothetical protein
MRLWPSLPLPRTTLDHHPSNLRSSVHSARYPTTSSHLLPPHTSFSPLLPSFVATGSLFSADLRFTFASSPTPTMAAKTGLIDTRVLEKEMPEKAKGAGTLKLKKRAPKQSKPGNWRENEVAGGKPTGSGSVPQAELDL